MIFLLLKIGFEELIPINKNIYFLQIVPQINLKDFLENIYFRHNADLKFAQNPLDLYIGPIFDLEIYSEKLKITHSSLYFYISPKFMLRLALKGSLVVSTKLFNSSKDYNPHKVCAFGEFKLIPKITEEDQIISFDLMRESFSGKLKLHSKCTLIYSFQYAELWPKIDNTFTKITHNSLSIEEKLIPTINFTQEEMLSTFRYQNISGLHSFLIYLHGVFAIRILSKHEPSKWVGVYITCKFNPHNNEINNHPVSTNCSSSTPPPIKESSLPENNVIQTPRATSGLAKLWGRQVVWLPALNGTILLEFPCKLMEEKIYKDGHLEFTLIALQSFPDGQCILDDLDPVYLGKFFLPVSYISPIFEPKHFTIQEDSIFNKNHKSKFDITLDELADLSSAQLSFTVVQTCCKLPPAPPGHYFTALRLDLDNDILRLVGELLESPPNHLRPQSVFAHARLVQNYHDSNSTKFDKGSHLQFKQLFSTRHHSGTTVDNLSTPQHVCSALIPRDDLTYPDNRSLVRWCPFGFLFCTSQEISSLFIPNSAIIVEILIIDSIHGINATVSNRFKNCDTKNTNSLPFFTSLKLCSLTIPINSDLFNPLAQTGSERALKLELFTKTRQQLVYSNFDNNLSIKCYLQLVQDRSDFKKSLQYSYEHISLKDYLETGRNDLRNSKNLYIKESNATTQSLLESKFPVEKPLVERDLSDPIPELNKNGISSNIEKCYRDFIQQYSNETKEDSLSITINETNITLAEETSEEAPWRR